MQIIASRARRCAFNLRIDEEAKQRIAVLASRWGCSQTFVIRQAVEKYLASLGKRRPRR